MTLSHNTKEIKNMQKFLELIIRVTKQSPWGYMKLVVFRKT